MPETALRPQDRAEGLSGGAGKRCYGKLDSLQESVFVSLLTFRITALLRSINFTFSIRLSFFDELFRKTFQQVYQSVQIVMVCCSGIVFPFFVSRYPLDGTTLFQMNKTSLNGF